ncbi:MAG: hypothetical protein ABJA74_12675 [Lapillicoccus sp.]
MRTLRYAGLGFVLGVSWAVVGRVWMRLVSTEPSFTVLGTLMLLLMAGVVGLALGLVFAARRREGSGWWRVLYLLVPVLFAGAGLPLLPAVVLGGWGLRRGPLGRVLAALAILSAPVILVAMTWEEVNTWLMPYPDNVYRSILAAGGLVLGGTAAWGSSVALGPWRPRPARSARSAEVAVVAA